MIDFDEPFGLSVAEAMLCGTPVIATNRGSMPELIRHGETGYLVYGITSALTAVAKLDQLSRLTCRNWAQEMFSLDRIVEGYAHVYQRILSG